MSGCSLCGYVFKHLCFCCTDPLAGGVLVAVEADLSLGIGGGRGPFLGTGTTNPQGLFHALGAAPGQMTENELLPVTF